MNDYLELANAPVMMTAAIVVVAFVALQSVLFLAVALRRGARAGLSRERMAKAFRTGATTSVIPTLPIVVALLAIAPVIGVPVSWMRLSVIGSAPYELMAAGIGAKSMGVDSLGGAGFTPTVFANAVWIMCIGSFWSIMLVSIFYKGIKRRYSLKAKADTRWREVMTGACFMGVFALFMADPITTGGSALVAFAAAAVAMLVCLALVVKLGLEGLKEFALTISMLAGMAACVLWTRLFGA